MIVEHTLAIDAPPDVVLRHFTVPDLYVRWHGVRADLDPRPGGVYRVTVLNRDVDRLGQFRRVEPTLVMFTWGWDLPAHEVPAGSTTVTVRLAPSSMGTLVHLTHEGLPNDEWAEAHRRGWRHYLARLAVACRGDKPGADPWNV